MTHVRSPASHAADRGTAARCASGSTRTPALLAEWGLPDDVAGLERFALTAVEALAPHVAVVKPQSAFFERFGSRGIAVLERVVAESRAAGALVLLDVKRGDIGSTSAGVRRRLPRPGLAAGRRRDHRQPVPRLRVARPDGRHRPQARRRRVRARADLQHGGPRGAARRAPSDGSRSPAPCSTTCARSTPGRSRSARSARWSAPPSARPSEDLDFNGPILAPGFGAQGGTVADLRRIFGAAARARAAELVARGARGRPRRRPRCATPLAAANDELRGARR